MVEHVKVGIVDGPSVAVVKQVNVHIFIVVSAEEGRDLPDSSDVPNTNIATL